jgi:hypothetical protein
MPLSPRQIYKLEKAVWTEADFDQMGWHDVVIHGIAFDAAKYELLLDIDYIFAWVDPEPSSKYFSFWISPCTLVFRNVPDFKAGIDGGLGLQLQGLTQANPRRPRNADFITEKTEWTWTLELNQGNISFSAVGFTQFTRKTPKHWESQFFQIDERAGISFEKVSC